MLLALVLAAGCPASTPPKPAEGTGGTPVVSKEEQASPELVAACGKHLELLHRIRFAKSDPAFAKLAGPPPAPDDLAASRRELARLGLKNAPEGSLDEAGTFAKLVQPRLPGGFSFLAWTPSLDDVGLARIRVRRPGQWKQLWGKPVGDYEVVLLDGFVAPDYPTFWKASIGTKETPAETPRHRGKVLVIDAAGLAQDAKRALSEKKPESAAALEALERASADELLKEVELREAGYLRFQDEVKDPARLDQAVTWTEILEGVPDLALVGGLVGSGDRPDELRRAGATQAIIVKLADADKEEKVEVFSLPRDARNKRLKELAPHYIRDALGR